MTLRLPSILALIAAGMIVTACQDDDSDAGTAEQSETSGETTTGN